jgi:hypothetical protein
MAVVVKHTFIEVVAPSTRSLNRSASDSALLDIRADADQPWDSEKPWMLSLTNKFQDLSDASTCVSLDIDESRALSEERPERKDTCWSDDDGAFDGTYQPFSSCEYMQSWWVPVAQYDHTVIGGEWHSGSVDEDSQEWRTTVMLRNMPNNYTRDMLIDLVDSMGFAGTYDLAYLPVDFKSQAGLGYAFVNFIFTDAALKCFEVFEGFRAWTVPSDKVCTVTWGSPYQGLEAHIERYRNSPVMHHSIPEEWKPVLFVDGRRGVFPPPTKPIKTPKFRQHPSNHAR